MIAKSLNSNSNARQRLDAFAASETPVDFKILEEFFDQLDPVSTTELQGDWQGGIIKTGKALDLTLKDYGFFKWTGKSFKSENNVSALMHRLFNFSFNFPIIGKAQLRPIQFRGKTSATMIYNFLPVMDHFRKIDEDTLFGAMDYKGKVVLYFYLYR